MVIRRSVHSCDRTGKARLWLGLQYVPVFIDEHLLILVLRCRAISRVQRLVFARFGHYCHGGIRARYSDETKLLNASDLLLVPSAKEMDGRFVHQIWNLCGKTNGSLAVRVRQ